MPAPPTGRPDDTSRYPGLLGLPGFLIPQARARAGRVVAAVLGAASRWPDWCSRGSCSCPQIGETKRENAAAEQRESAAAQERQRRRLIAEQRPRRAVSTARAGHHPLGARERGPRDRGQRDSRPGGARHGRRPSARPRRATPPASRSPAAPRCAASSRLSCTAVTSEIRKEGVNEPACSAIPFLARVDYTTGRYAWCKVERPARGRGPSRRHGRGWKVPRVCGGGWPPLAPGRLAQGVLQVGPAEVVAELRRPRRHGALSGGHDPGHVAVEELHGQGPARGPPQGRWSTRPRTCESSRLVTGSGALTFTGPAHRRRCPGRTASPQPRPRGGPTARTAHARHRTAHTQLEGRQHLLERPAGLGQYHAGARGHRPRTPRLLRDGAPPSPRPA